MQKTENGDKCHYNICGMTRGESRSLLKSSSIGDYELCINGTTRTLTYEDADELKRVYLAGV